MKRLIIYSLPDSSIQFYKLGDRITVSSVQELEKWIADQCIIATAAKLSKQGMTVVLLTRDRNMILLARHVAKSADFLVLSSEEFLEIIGRK